MNEMMGDAEATVRFAILDAISTSGELIKNPENLVEKILKSITNKNISRALMPFVVIDDTKETSL